MSSHFYHNNERYALVIKKSTAPFGCDKPAIIGITITSEGWGSKKFKLVDVPELVHNDDFTRAILSQARIQFDNSSPPIICARVSKSNGGPYRGPDLRTDFGQIWDYNGWGPNHLSAGRLFLMEFLWRRSLEYGDVGRFYLLPAVLNVNHRSDGGWFRYGQWVMPHQLNMVVCPDYGHAGAELQHPEDLGRPFENRVLPIPACYGSSTVMPAHKKSSIRAKLWRAFLARVDWSFRKLRLKGKDATLSLKGSEFYSDELKRSVREREKKQAAEREALGRG